MYKSYSNLGVNEDEQNKNVINNSVLEITNHNQKSQYVIENKFVVIEIYADWCGPCKKIGPEFSLLASEYNKNGLCLLTKQKYEFLSPEETKQIQSIPYFQYFMNGKQIDHTIGANIEEVKNKINQYIGIENRQNNNFGPIFNKNSIRNHKNTIPTFEDSRNFQPKNENQPYHRPFQNNDW